MDLARPRPILSCQIVRPARVGPEGHTSVRIQVQNIGEEISRSVTIALADSVERSSRGIVLRQIGDMPAGSIREAELSLPYPITDSLRLGALAVAAFPLQHAIDEAASPPN